MTGKTIGSPLFPGVFLVGARVSYRAEIWNDTGAFVEQTLAITISRAVDGAACSAAQSNFQMD
jgi:hypothetical protein